LVEKTEGKKVLGRRNGFGNVKFKYVGKVAIVPVLCVDLLTLQLTRKRRGVE